MRPAAIDVADVVVGHLAETGLRIRHADVGAPVVHRDPVRAGEGPEVGIERAVLLHDHDDVLDLVDAFVGYGAVRGQPGDEWGGYQAKGSHDGEQATHSRLFDTAGSDPAAAAHKQPDREPHDRHRERDVHRRQRPGARVTNQPADVCLDDQ